MKHLFFKIVSNAPFVVRSGRKIKKYLRNKRIEKQQQKQQGTDKNGLLNDLQKIGVKKGDSLLVHSSLSKIGYVNGGAKTVINALLETIGEEGNLLMPSFPADTFHKAYLQKNPVFDIQNTSSNTGAITELFRKTEGVKRSFHPTDAVCVKGPLATYFTKDHFGQLTPYNKFSPFYKLYEKQGKILMLGVSFDNAGTNLHTLEDAVDFKFPVYDEKIFEVKMLDEHGKEHFMKTKVHNPEYSVKRKCDELIPLFEKEKVLVKGKIGEANSMLIDAKKMFEVMLKYYHEKGVTMYTPHGS